MITINLSEKQARDLLNCVGWDSKLPEHLTLELFRQLEHKLMPVSTGAAELAVWRHESGLTEMEVERWKRKNETVDFSTNRAFINF